MVLSVIHDIAIITAPTCYYNLRPCHTDVQVIPEYSQVVEEDWPICPVFKTFPEVLYELGTVRKEVPRVDVKITRVQPE